jgi:hypothetical protein
MQQRIERGWNKDPKSFESWISLDWRIRKMVVFTRLDSGITLSSDMKIVYKTHCHLVDGYPEHFTRVGTILLTQSFEVHAAAQ